MKRTILGFDPATTGYSFATVTTDGRRFSLVTSGSRRTSTFEDARAHLGELHAQHPDALWAVEGVAGFLSAERVGRQRSGSFDLSALMDNAIWAGFLIGCTPHPNATIVLPANAEGRRPSWRLYLTKYARADDKAVSHSLNYWLEGGLPVRSRNKHGQPLSYAVDEHQRDAIGLAVAAANLGGSAAGKSPKTPEQILAALAAEGNAGVEAGT